MPLKSQTATADRVHPVAWPVAEWIAAYAACEHD
jgi:hypothetical protein